MALIGTIAINAKVNTAPLAKGLKGAAGMVQSFSASVTHAGLGLRHLFAGATVAGVVDAGKKIFNVAADLAEQSNRAGVMFGDFASGVVEESNRMAEAFGISRSEFLASASAFSGIFQAAGYAKGQAADLSVHFTKLATDLSSLTNIPVAEALAKIQSGLAGEVRPLREVGVFMSEEAIKAKAAKMGIAALGTELTESQKIQARVAFITEGLSFATGDLARTADSAQNSARALSGRVEGLAQTIGTALLPIAQAVLGEMGTAVQALSLYWEDNKAGVVAWGQSTVGAVGESAKSIGVLQTAIGYVADGWQFMTNVFHGVQAVITTGLATIVKGLSYLGSAIDYAVEKISGLKMGLGDYLKTYGEDLDRLGKEQLKTFLTDLEKPAASTGLNAYFDRAAEKIKAVRKEVGAIGPDISKIKPANAEAKTVGPKLASAATAGSKEAANAILRSRYGAALTSKGPQEQTAKNTSQMVELLKKIATGQTSPQGAAAVSTTAALAINL